MKIGLFTGGFYKYPIERAFQAAYNNGYDGIEIGGFRPHAYPTDLINGEGHKIVELSRTYSLPIISYAPENTGSPHSLVFENPRLNRESLDYFKTALEAAKTIGSGYCMFACNHPGFGRNKEEVKALFIENMQILAEYAQNIEQMIILEPVTPYEGTILVTSDDLYWALKEINSPWVKGMLDLACPITAREPVVAYFEKMGTDIRHIHFIDATKDSEDHLIPGDGEINFKQLIHMLRKNSYEGYLSLELFQQYETEPDFAAARGIEVIRTLLEMEN